MKKYSLTLSLSLLFLLFISNVFGLAPTEKTSLGNHLYEVNRNWAEKNNPLFKNSIAFTSEVERIQFHLLLVESELRTQSTSSLTSAQKKNRNLALDILHDYALEMKFPKNTGHTVRQPYFIDIYGTYCAVGFLVKETGFDEVSKEISRHQNYSYVKEIKSEELIKWSKDYGFSLDELALIQPTYGPTETYTQVEGGSNGNVTCSYSGNTNWIIGGDFDTLNNLPCLNVGQNSNNQLTCFGDGIAGEVIGVGPFGANGVSVGGNLPFNNKIYPVANFDGTNWNYDTIPNRLNPNVTAYSANGYLKRIAIDHPTNSNEQELWRFYQGTWTLEANVLGRVNYIDKNYNVYAGDFDSIQIVSSGTWYATKNAIYYSSGEWKTVNGDVPDIVKTAEIIGQTLYLGGTYVNTPNPNSVILSRTLNGQSQPLLIYSNFDQFSIPCVKDIEIYSPGKLLVAGDLSMEDTWMYFGKNLLKFDLANGMFTPSAYLNDDINVIGKIGGIFYLGGNFTGQYSGNNLKHLASHNPSAGINQTEAPSLISLSPNPSNGKFQLSGIENLQNGKIEIVDLQGKTWLTINDDLKFIDASGVPDGIYLVKISNEDLETTTLKWVKLED